MNDFQHFIHGLKSCVMADGTLSIGGARKAVLAINDFLYTTYKDIGTIDALGKEWNFFSEFHKFWANHHKEILNCSIDCQKCAEVADALHEIYTLTGGKAFLEIYDTCDLAPEEVCRVRFLTANQDFRGSRDFASLAKIYDSDNSIFDIQNIYENPDKFLTDLNLSDLSQNDKRSGYAKNVAKFLIDLDCDSPYELIDIFHNDIKAIREALLACIGAGYGNKKTDMFLRDMVVLGVWRDVKNFDAIDVASDINTIKVALRTGIIHTEIPLLTSFLDIFSYQYSHIEEMNAKAWRTVWEIWQQKYPDETLSGPSLLDYFIYSVIGKQFCQENLSIFEGDSCGHTFKWHSGRNRTCQECYKHKVRGMKAHLVKKVMPCEDADGYIAITQSKFIKSLPPEQKFSHCPFEKICGSNRKLQPPKSISIIGRTGWSEAYSYKGDGGGGLMS
ncbi:MAG: hypothetical protein LUC85_05395 [Bacteroidales bacterium]|nr:hypothetical protein [Bacteroidales bacterium]MCD8394255.1 hypothetical protein [Bacteroidales bacterium]